MKAPRAARRAVHFWNEGVREPPCGTPESRFAWSDEVEDVTCEGCREALAGDGGDLAQPLADPDADRPS